MSEQGPKVLPVRWYISRGSDRTIHLRVADAASGLAIVEMDMTPEQFAFGVTAMSTEGQATVYNNFATLGRTREAKTVQIHTERRELTKAQAKRLLREYEVDGWEADLSQLDNHHRWSRTKNGYAVSVGLSRYV